MTSTLSVPQSTVGTAPDVMQALHTQVVELQRQLDEWRLRKDNSLPPRDTVFTLYNITVAARNKHGVFAKHTAVKPDVESLVYSGIFTIPQDECLIDIPGKPGIERPRLFHPPEISHAVAEQMFNDYGNITTNVQFVPSKVLGDGGAQSQLALPGPSNSIAIVAPSITPTATPGTGGKQSDGTYAVDKRGRLWIPSDSLRKIGATIGSNVYVFQQPTMLVVTKTLPAGTTHAAVYKVDSSNNIAVSKSAFDEANLTGGKYKIDDSAGTEVRIQAA